MSTGPPAPCGLSAKRQGPDRPSLADRTGHRRRLPTPEQLPRRVAARATHPEQQPARGLDSATAAAVLARINARTATTSPGPSSSSESSEESEDPGGATTHLLRLAPFLTLALGPQKAADIAAHLDDAALAEVEALAYTQDATRLQATDPAIVPLLDEILAQLSTHPHFTGQVRHTFTALVDQSLRFLKSRIDLTAPTCSAPAARAQTGRRFRPTTTGASPGQGNANPSKATCSGTSTTGSSQASCTTSSKSRASMSAWAAPTSWSTSAPCAT